MIGLVDQDGRCRDRAPAGGGSGVLRERVHAVHGGGRPPEPAVLRPLHHRHGTAIGIFRAVGAHVFLVGTPVDDSSVTGWDRLDGIYRQLTQADPLAVTYLDAGAAVESPGGGFTWRLPCMSMEPSCGANGTNVVRSPDGIHFCPAGTPATAGVTGPCDEYSPGAFRFALAIVSAAR